MEAGTLKPDILSSDQLKAGVLKIANAVERVFAVASLLLFTSALLPHLQKQSGTTMDNIEGNPMLQYFWYGIYGVTLVHLFVRWKSVMGILQRDKIVILLTLFTISSVLWSFAPEVTMRRGIALLGTTMFGVYFAARFNLVEQLRLVAWAMGIAGILSVAFALFIPEYGIYVDDRGEAWRGIYTHKNTLGQVMTLGGIVFLILAAQQKWKSWPMWAGFGLSVCLLLLSQSKTALVIFLGLLLLVSLLRTIVRHYSLAVPLIIISFLILGGISVLFYGYVENALELGFESMGRDLTLTGRTELWAAMFEKISQHPWFGYGYNAFWLGLDGESADIFLMTGWLPTHGHNGTLDIWLQLGVIGVVLFVASYISQFKKAVRFIGTSTGMLVCWPFLYLMFMLLYSLTENTLLRQNNIFWVLYVSLGLSLLSDAKRAASQGGEHLNRERRRVPR
ncbi:O-antigen ligase family protein [Brevibacillus sp. B_LB10_24]|uniref:O-antigen ligase family protein n=1 Tax=Brevibacillus sp. B_LB10_24 TaxID=3380645 RepID=UPI0038BB079B